MSHKVIFLILALALTCEQFDLTSSLPTDDGNREVNGPTTDSSGIVEPPEETKPEPQPTDPPLRPPMVERAAEPEGYRVQERLLSRKGSPFEVQHVEFKKLRSNRRKRAVYTTLTGTWPHKIPYKIKDGMPAHIEHRLRDVLEFVEDYVCVQFIEEPNFNVSDNDYNLTSYIRFAYSGQRCFADVGRGTIKTPIRHVSTCNYWDTMIHEVFHSLGAIHENQAPTSLSYIYLMPSNIDTRFYNNFIIKSAEGMEFSSFDSSSVMMYAATSFTKTGLPTIRPIQDDLYSMGAKNVHTTLYELNRVYKCRERECNNTEVDCALGYYTKAHGECQCVCPERFMSRTNCSTLYDEDDRPQWPDATLMLWSAGPGSCPDNMEEGVIKISAYVFPFADTDMKEGGYLTIRICSNTTSSSADDLSALPKGDYCVVKPSNVSCHPFVDASYSMYTYGVVTTTGNVGDVTVVNNKNITMRFCCRNDGNYALPLRNAHKFRMLPFSSTNCHPVDGMVSRKGKTGLYTSTVYLSDVTPKLLKYSTSFYIYHCMYYAPTYGCSQQIELNATNRIAHVTTPGFDEGARTPNKRCFYYFKLPKGSRPLLSLDTFDIHTHDRFLIKRYSPWVKPLPITSANYPKYILTKDNFLFIEHWSYYEDVTNKGVSFDVKLVALKDEMCYDADKKGSDYTGNKWMTERRELCVPWTEAQTCADFPYKGLSLLDLKYIGNKCRNPGGHLAEPWCYTFVHGTTCNKAYCDACNLMPQQDTIDNCTELIAADPSFCTTSLLRLPCAESCNIFAFPPTSRSSDCPDGWNEYGDRCWKWFSDTLTQEQAEDRCNSYKGTIFRLRNQADTNKILDFQKDTSDDQAKLSIWANGRYMPHSAHFETLGDLQPLIFEDLASTAERHSTSKPNLYIRAYGQTEAGKLDTTSESTTYNFICERHRSQTFGPPSTPPYSVASEELKSEYFPGDRVTFTCTRPGFEPLQATIECRSDGWPTLEAVCSPCRQGWNVYKDRCWIWNSSGRSQQASVNYCASINSTMFKIYNQQDLDEIRNFKQNHPSSAAKWNTWINAERHEDGNYYTVDGDNTLVNFTVWAPNAVHTIASKTAVYLIGEDKTNEGTYQTEYPTKPYRVFCEQQKGADVVCGDNGGSKQKCMDLLSFIPDACSNPSRADLAEACSDTCGKCSDDAGEDEDEEGLDECPSGWLVRGNRCYKWFGSAKTQSSAETYCNNLGGTIFKVKNAGDLSALRSFLASSTAYGSKWNVWMNARRDSEGAWKTVDGQSTVEYFNWVSSINPATHQHQNVFLLGEDKADKGFYSLASSNSVFRFFCQLTLTQASLCSIPAPANGAHATETEAVGVGQVVHFECDAGLFWDEGTHARTCLPDLTLAGKDLVCSDTPRTIRLNEDLIIPRPKQLDLNTAFVFAVDEFRVQYNGKVSAWHFFARGAGEIAFAVFRINVESSDTFTMIGHNSVSITRTNEKFSYRVPESERITVQPGDFLGVYTTTAKIATHVCSSSLVKLMVMRKLSIGSLEDLESPQTYSTKCVIPSIGATIQTVSAQ